jgi:hypothetical protein
MTLVNYKRLPRPLREFVGRFPGGDKPAIADIYKAGESMGLSKEEINRVYYQSNHRSGIKDFIARHWTILLPVTLLAVLVAFVLLRVFSGDLYRSTYPSGAAYGVISPNDFKKRLSISNTSSHT